MKKINVYGMAVLALLTALSLIIFVVESMFPTFVPIPGVKLGLSNVVTLFLILNADKKSTLIVLLLRIVLASVFAGQIISLWYSLAGGLLCFAAMSVTNSIVKGKPVWFISVVGAVFHNIGQITVAVLLLSWSVLAYLPFLLITGCIAGVLTGMIADVTCRKLERSGMLGKMQEVFRKKRFEKESKK